MKEHWQQRHNIFLSLENLCTLLLAKEKAWKHSFSTNRKISQNRTEKQIMLSKTTVNWLFIFIAYFDWRIGVFQQTVVRVYYILKACVCYSLSIFIFTPNDSPLKTMKNTFYFIKKTLFILEIFKFSYFPPPFFFSLLDIPLEDDQ